MRFVLDPVSLDAAGQISGFWSQEQVDPVCDLFPYRFSRLQTFAAMPPVGTRIEGRVIIREITDRDLRCDLEVLDLSGRVLYRVEDWTDRRFFQSQDLWTFRASPRDGALSKPAPQLLGDGDVSQFSCVRLDCFPPGFLDASFGIWGKMLCGLMGTRAEKDVWQSMGTAADPRRAEWLLVRCVAKDAVRALVAQRRGVSLFPADIALHPDARGRMSVGGGWVRRLGIAPVVSAAYCDGQAIAVASLNPSDRVGVSLERLNGTDSAVPSEQEQSLLAGLPQASRSEWHLRVQCARKALAQALGADAASNLQPTDFEQVTLKQLTGKVEMTLPGSSNVFAVQTSRQDDFIYATYAGPGRNHIS